MPVLIAECTIIALSVLFYATKLWRGGETLHRSLRVTFLYSSVQITNLSYSKYMWLDPRNVQDVKSLIVSDKNSDSFAAHFARLIPADTEKKAINGLVDYKVEIMWKGDPISCV